MLVLKSVNKGKLENKDKHLKISKYKDVNKEYCLSFKFLK